MIPLTRFFRAWAELTRAIEASLIDNLAATSPWLAPIIPAYLAYRNMTAVLLFPAWVALVGAVVVETLGLATVHTVFSLWDYNITRRKTDQRAPLVAAVLTAGSYITIVLVVNVLLDQRRQVEMIAQALLSLLSVVAAVTLAVRATHSRRLVEIERERQDRRDERQQRKGAAEITSPPTPLAGMLPEPRRDWRDLASEERANLVNLTSREIATRYHLSDRTARLWLARVKNKETHDHTQP